jgi:multidrug efflux system outer membrane protein
MVGTQVERPSEVESALASEFALREREAILEQSAKDNQQVVELEEVRYRVGARDVRSVGQQQLALYAARMTLLRAQSEQRIQRVNLYLALGGSFGETAQLSSAGGGTRR